MLVHDFTDTAHSTRFLGDLYQDLSAATRDRYALFQTPEFVEEFILDRTLEPAVVEFGLAALTLIDPTCGSGHFLLGAFHRLLRKWQLAEPGTKTEVLVQRALDAIAGADLNPYAIAIARFRLLVAALHESDIRRLADARNYRLHLAVGDSLLHGKSWGARQQTQLQFGGDDLAHIYRAEDAEAISDVLGRRYHVVVGNPPYVTVKDPTLNAEYRRYGSCRGKYSLAVPFTERFFDLALPSEDGAGYIGMITANSFMKREFGKTLIEKHLPRWDLTHVIDSSDAYIPNHGTPTVIMFARNRSPLSEGVRMVLGIRGEPNTPEDPARGKVWNEIVSLVDRAGAAGEFVSVSDVERPRLGKHPWSIGGGGAAELKEHLDESAKRTLSDESEVIGFGAVTREDELFCIPPQSYKRWRIDSGAISSYGAGDLIRDWSAANGDDVVFPYVVDGTVAPSALGQYLRVAWLYREQLWNRQGKGFKTKRESGGVFYEYSMFYPDRYWAKHKIAFAFVSTHNHFVLDRGGKVFNRSAPVIKLPESMSENDHLALVGLLNSSTACFWMKQVCHCKGTQGINEGGKSEKWEQFFEFSGTNIEQFPLVDVRPLELAQRLVTTAQAWAALQPDLLISKEVPTRSALDSAHVNSDRLRERMIFLQEELDWWCYQAYGLVPDDLSVSDLGETPPGIQLGQRAFEIAMGREMAAGRLATTWFARHRSTSIADVPSGWSADYRNLVELRLQAIASNPKIGLIERPEYKRRWNDEPWAEKEARALRHWLLTRMEERRYWFTADGRAQITSCARLTDRLRDDRDFIQVAALYRGRDDFDLTALVLELAESDAVPFLAAYRYSPAGRRKRAVWERTWELQRQEDAIDARTLLPESDEQHLTAERAAAEKARTVGEIPLPPKYSSGDFAKQAYWRLRGKLDVPKERFILYPGAERDVDATPVIGWAGWDHLEQARALAEFTVAMRENEAWSKERIAPLLAGLDELVPWLKQWHNDRDPATGERLGDYFEGFVAEEARTLRMTVDQLRSLEVSLPSRRTRRTPAARPWTEETP